MNYNLALAILIIGLSGIVAQIVLVRELWVAFLGNELTLGIILANWVISEAIGVFIIGKSIEKIRQKIGAFITLEIIFLLVLPFSLYISRTFKEIAGIPFGQGLGLWPIFYSSFLIIFPVAFCHGGLFSCGCKIYSPAKDGASSIGSVYALETIGTIIGGITLTYILIPFLRPFQIIFTLISCNLIICLLFFRQISAFLKYTILSLIIITLCLFFSAKIHYIERASINSAWKPKEVLDYRNSVYGNVAVTRELTQYTFFYNGIPIITTPTPNIQFVEDFGHLPLLFHSNPKDVLVISQGAGGLINEIIKYPVKKIDYAELDPLIIKMLKKYPSQLTEREFKDSRVNVVNLDGRVFLKKTPNRYDVVFIGLSSQSDLSSNRLFTEDFFSLVKNRLKSNGILAVWLSGSLTYLSQELKDLNSCILNALKNTYDYVRIIPGDYNIFLASPSKDIMQVSSGIILQRKAKRNIESTILHQAYLDYRLNSRFLDWFLEGLNNSTKSINQDTRPVAVFETLLLWNRQFSPGFANALAAFKNLNIRWISVFIFFLSLIFLYLFLGSSKVNVIITYNIMTTGFFGMLASLLLIFSYQVFFGVLYHRLGLLISIFMSGIAVGSILITKNLQRTRNELRLLVYLEASICIFSYFLSLVIPKIIEVGNMANLIFVGLFFASGLLMGSEFPLASKICLGEKKGTGEVSGLISASDLAGGWIAGILGGVILLPVLGIFNTCIVIFLLKLSSLILLLILKKGKIMSGG
ncbi:MAG: hypothetical protein PHU96_04580 [Candidatus Omnitrophica bacterium]|nr:hypothetical protein [Candidatus Omnitrophota bacterium]